MAARPENAEQQTALTPPSVLEAPWRWLLWGAGAFNLAFALVGGLADQALFGFFSLQPPPGWPVAVALIGLLGAAYLHAAERAHHRQTIIAIGLASKVAMPLLWLGSVAAGGSSPRLFPLILVGDLVWQLPLLACLWRHWPHRRTAMVWLGVALHLAAGFGLLAVAPGTEAQSDLALRPPWIQEHLVLWTAVWMFWTLASMSLLATCLVWRAWLVEGAPRTAWPAAAACAVVAVGLVCDLTGESVLIARATQSGPLVEAFQAAYRAYQWLSPVAANGLYCLGGLALSWLSWQAGKLRGKIGAIGLGMWVLGLGLSVAGLFEHHGAMTFFGAAVILLFVPWSAALGWRLRCAPS